MLAGQKPDGRERDIQKNLRGVFHDPNKKARHKTGLGRYPGEDLNL